MKAWSAQKRSLSSYLRGHRDSGFSMGVTGAGWAAPTGSYWSRQRLGRCGKLSRCAAGVSTAPKPSILRRNKLGAQGDGKPRQTVAACRLRLSVTSHHRYSTLKRAADACQTGQSRTNLGPWAQAPNRHINASKVAGFHAHSTKAPHETDQKPGRSHFHDGSGGRNGDPMTSFTPSFSGTLRMSA